MTLPGVWNLGRNNKRTVQQIQVPICIANYFISNEFEITFMDIVQDFLQRKICNPHSVCISQWVWQQTSFLLIAPRRGQNIPRVTRGKYLQSWVVFVGKGGRCGLSGLGFIAINNLTLRSPQWNCKTFFMIAVDTMFQMRVHLWISQQNLHIWLEGNEMKYQTWRKMLQGRRIIRDGNSGVQVSVAMSLFKD